MKKEKVIPTITFSFISLNVNISLNGKHALDFAKIPERNLFKKFLDTLVSIDQNRWAFCHFIIVMNKKFPIINGRQIVTLDWKNFSNKFSDVGGHHVSIKTVAHDF